MPISLRQNALRGDGIKVSPWTADPDGAYCSLRYIEGTDPKIVANRVAFIEKTPRIRDGAFPAGNDEHNDSLNWHARGWKGDGGWDEDSQGWCDARLIALGYIVPDPKPYNESDD
jgi:hypothetical protein